MKSLDKIITENFEELTCEQYLKLKYMLIEGIKHAFDDSRKQVENEPLYKDFENYLEHINP